MTDTSGAGDAGPAADGDQQPPAVHRLAADCTPEDVAEGEYYHATVDGVVDYGVFVELAPDVSGLAHESTLDTSHEVGEELVVALTEIRADGAIGFEPVDLTEYRTVERGHDRERTPIADVDGRVGDTVRVEGRVVQIRQTGGPTLFRVRDESHAVQCAAFEAAGVRAHPDVAIGDHVRVDGVVETRDGSVQIEVDRLVELDGDAADAVAERVADAIEERATPHEVDPLVDWPALAGLFPELERVAELLRRTVLEGRPIRIRHHADGDGMCASVPLQLALERFVADTYHDPEASRHLLRRSPSKAPFYEMEDATRDLNYSLADRERHGQQLPLLVMLDNGSTAEDVPAYRTLAHYDVPIVVVDHHHPDPEAVEGLLAAHVNPYLEGEDYRLTTGMLCVELARMIAPDLDEQLRHVPAVAGLSDRSSADAMGDYLGLAADAGYEERSLGDVSEALDYAAFHLRYDPGTELVADLLDLGDGGRHEELVPLLAERAREDTERQLDAALPHVQAERAANDARLRTVDLEEHAHRFTYPPPGKTTGAIHDRVVEETGDPTVTVGYGPDFAVLRSDGVRLDIPEMVADLNDELPGAGVQGGGHLVVGSIRFVPGMREAVLDALLSKVGEAALDAELGAGAGAST
jgi:RecJ-like exonuclease